MVYDHSRIVRLLGAGIEQLNTVESQKELCSILRMIGSVANHEAKKIKMLNAFAQDEQEYDFITSDFIKENFVR